MAGVQAGVHDRLQEGDQVSIPQSGWRGFKRKSQQGQLQLFQGFNPSVGMAGVQARTGATATSGTVWFQSLSRDGGGSSLGDVRLDVDQGLGFNPSVGMAGVQAWLISQSSMGVVVSIPQSGWRGFKRGTKMVIMDYKYKFQSLSRDGGGSSRAHFRRVRAADRVSIPQSGWRGFKPRSAWTCSSPETRFNPSVGMAGVQAGHLLGGRQVHLVSIPQSGWRGFKPEALTILQQSQMVSIPQSGWRGFKR